MGARHGPSATPWQSASMPSTPGDRDCGKFYGFLTLGTLPPTESGAPRAACQSLKRSSCSDWGFLGTSLDQLQRRTITVSSPPPCDHHLICGDLLVVQDPPGWEWWMRTFSPRTVGSTRLGGRQRTGMAVWQRSVRSWPLRRRTLQILVRTAKCLLHQITVSVSYFIVVLLISQVTFSVNMSWIHTSSVTLCAF